MPHQCTTCGRGFPDGSKEMLSGCPDCGGNKFQFTPAGSTSDDDSSSESGSTGGADSAVATGTDADRDPADADQDGAVSRAASTVRTWLSDDADQSSREGTTTETGQLAEGTESGPLDRDGRSDREPANARRDAGSGLTDDFPEWPDTARPPTDRTDESDTQQADEPDTQRASETGVQRSAETDTVESTGEARNPEPRAGESPGPDVGRRDGDEDSAQASARSDVVSSADLPPPSERSTAPAGAGAQGESDPTPENGRVVSEPSPESPSLEELREELNDQFESIKIIRPGQYELNLMELYDREEYIVSLQEDGRYVIDVPDSWREGDDVSE